jgi:hypothetical protein
MSAAGANPLGSSSVAAATAVMKGMPELRPNRVVPQASQKPRITLLGGSIEVEWRRTQLGLSLYVDSRFHVYPVRAHASRVYRGSGGVSALDRTRCEEMEDGGSLGPAASIWATSLKP